MDESEGCLKTWYDLISVAAGAGAFVLTFLTMYLALEEQWNFAAATGILCIYCCFVELGAMLSAWRRED